MIQEFKHECLTGNPCFVHADFAPYLTKFCTHLKERKMKALINQGVRYVGNPVKGAIVTPAGMSNHYVGFAIDCNLYDSSGHFWNSKSMKAPSPEIKDFIHAVVEEGMRWGGYFNTPDEVHYDYPLNIHNPERYKELYAEIQKVI